MWKSRPSLGERLLRIDWLILDVDGVLTDGSITYANNGRESKTFHVRDGFGIKAWHGLGKRTAIITGRTSQVVSLRSAELGIQAVYQGASDKVSALQQFAAEQNCNLENACAVGDDLPDLGVLQRCGLAVAVADAAAEVRAQADYVTQAVGGRGAVREVIEWILQAQGCWRQVVSGFGAAQR